MKTERIEWQAGRDEPFTVVYVGKDNEPFLYVVRGIAAGKVYRAVSTWEGMFEGKEAGFIKWEKVTESRTIARVRKHLVEIGVITH